MKEKLVYIQNNYIAFRDEVEKNPNEDKTAKYYKIISNIRS